MPHEPMAAGTSAAGGTGGAGAAGLLRVVAWETTRRCVLRCRHCRGAAQNADYAGELTTAEGKRLIDGLAAAASPLLILTGGEPMTRADIYELARYASDRGLRVAMAPCGPLLTPETAACLRECGVRRISISLDGSGAEAHDRFRGVPGAYDAALRGIGHARQAGLEFQINTTVTRENVGELPSILEQAVKLGAAALDVFFLVPTGRGRALADLALSAEDCEGTLDWVARTAPGCAIGLKTTCAPHGARVRLQAGRCVGPAAQGHGAGGGYAGCMAGRGFLFVSHRGIVQPCGFLDVPCGDLRACGFDFGGLLAESSILKSLRDPSGYGGKCGICEYRNACGGCRARAYAHAGDYLAEEPTCSYVPKMVRGNAALASRENVPVAGARKR